MQNPRTCLSVLTQSHTHLPIMAYPNMRVTVHNLGTINIMFYLAMMLLFLLYLSQNTTILDWKSE